MVASGSGEEAAEVELAELIALATSLGTDGLEGIEPVLGPQDRPPPVPPAGAVTRRQATGPLPAPA